MRLPRARLLFVTGWRALWPLIASAACSLPRDPSGTLDRVRGHSIRVGFVVDTPWTTDSAAGAGGVEASLVQALARGLATRVEWIRGHESELLEALRHRELDLVIGGLSGNSPWRQRVGFTRPFYTDTVTIGGAPGAVPPASLEDLPIAVHPGDPAASEVRRKGGRPLAVRDLASSSFPIAAPTWRLAQLGRQPNTKLVLLQQPHVLATPPGENAFLLCVEQMLIAEGTAVPNLLRQLRQ